MTRAEQVGSQDWYEQLPPERAKLVNTLFPFKRPPLEVARNCFLVADPQLQPPEGYHYTTSDIFLFPRKDKKLLIPTEAFGSYHPEFDLRVIVTHTLPYTHKENWRRWAVWCSRLPFEEKGRSMPLGFTPELARTEVARAHNIKQIYQRMLDGDGSPTLQEELKSLMSQIIQEGWLQYYTDQLPQKIIDSKADAEDIIRGVFKGLKWKIERAKRYWEELTPDDKKLLANAFRIVVKTKFSPPYAYLAAGVDQIRKNTLAEDDKLLKARNPREFVSRTQGVSLDEIEAVYIPNDASSFGIYPIVLERMRKLGIDGKVRPISDLDNTPKYASPSDPYREFNLGLLAQLIHEGKIVPLVSSEWQESDLLKQV